MTLFTVVSGYLAYRMNDRLLARSISIPVFEVPLQDGKILWSLVNNDQILNATIMPDSAYHTLHYPYLLSRTISTLAPFLGKLND
jgi:hypothetical protein